jgi:thiol:disulfide interchange protein DsbD
MLLYSLLLLVGVVTRQDDPLHPLAGLILGANPAATAQRDNGPLFTRVKTLEQLDRALADAQAAGKPVALDLYADWCIACKAMEREIFPAPSVRSGLSDFATVQLDLTENSEEQRALLDKYHVFGPPALLFFTPEAQWLSQETLQGEPTVNLLTEKLEKLKQQL